MSIVQDIPVVLRSRATSLACACVLIDEGSGLLFSLECGICSNLILTCHLDEYPDPTMLLLEVGRNCF